MPDPVSATVGSAVTGLIGGSMASSAAKSAARTSANAQLAAAQIAADEARFRPVGVRTAFGSSQFGFDPETERLVSAGYTVSPEIAALRDRLMGMAPGSLTAAERTAGRFAPAEAAAGRLFGLGGQLIPTATARTADPFAMAQAERLSALGTGITPASYDPTAAAQQYAEQQFSLLAPERQRQREAAERSTFGRGRQGLFLSGMGQPELYGLSQAQEEQNAAIAAAAQQRARQELQQDIALGTQLSGQGLATRTAAENLARQRFAEDLGLGTGLFTTGANLYGLAPQAQVQSLAPFQTQLGLAQTLEQLGQAPLDIGAQLGGRAAQAGGLAGQSLLQGGLGAAQTRLQGSLVGPTMMAGTLNSLTSNPYFMQSMSNVSNPFAVGGMFSPYQVSTQGPSGLSYQQSLTNQWDPSWGSV